MVCTKLLWAFADWYWQCHERMLGGRRAAFGLQQSSLEHVGKLPASQALLPFPRLWDLCFAPFHLGTAGEVDIWAFLCMTLCDRVTWQLALWGLCLSEYMKITSQQNSSSTLTLPPPRRPTNFSSGTLKVPQMSLEFLLFLSPEEKILCFTSYKMIL